VLKITKTTGGENNLTKVASPPNTDGSVVFARLRQHAPTANACFLGPTLDPPSPQPVRHLDRFSVFARLTSHDGDTVTDRPTDHVTRSVTIGRIYVYIVIRCGLTTETMQRQTTGSTRNTASRTAMVPHFSSPVFSASPSVSAPIARRLGNLQQRTVLCRQTTAM